MGTFQLFGSLMIFSLFCYSYGYDKLNEVTLKSFFPPSHCTYSPTRRGSVKLVNMHGPCFENDAPTPLEILHDDQLRVASIHSKMQDSQSTFAAESGLRLPSQAKSRRSQSPVSLVAKSGIHLGSRSYVVTIELGSQRKEISLIIDTGSDLTWTQCRPCKVSCYDQRETIFDPTQSSSYSNIPLNSGLCDHLLSSTTTYSSPKYTSTSNCVYRIKYADGSYSDGNFAKENMNVGADQELIFGCGQDNKGKYGKTAGILGLGRGFVSVVSQTAQTNFSYCLPSQSSPSGYLSFGNSRFPDSVKFTPLVKSSKGPSFYFVHLKGIRVGGNMLSIQEMVFSKAGTIIDSGTVITHLPRKAYAKLRDAFRRLMTDYRLTNPFGVLDTCYDFAGITSIRVPPIEFIFGEDVVMEVETSRIFYTVDRKNPTKQCLAFTENEDDNAIGVLGSYQQVTQHMVFDLARGRLGIGKGGCQ